MRGRPSILLITMLLLSLTVAGVGAFTTVDDQGFLSLDPATVEVEEGLETSVLPDWPFFDVNVTISNVTDLSGVVVSVHWNTSLLSCTKPDVTPGFTAGDLMPVSMPNATGWMITWEFDAGNMSEAANSMMAGKPLRTVPEGEWRWVFTLTFEYIGPSPAPGDPDIETDIIIVNQPDYSMSTTWCESWGPYHDFEPYPEPVPGKPWIVSTCHFKYVPYTGLPYPPQCCFEPPPPRYVCTDVAFDASCSKSGFDGDDICPITEYRWDFGDGNVTTVNNPIITHHYKVSGDFTVNLTVYAPGIGPYIDDAYVDTDTCTQPISIKSMVLTFIDIYTENWRWPGYITEFNGTGPDVEADAYSPQENVTLFALVMYNNEIVQNKPVAFEIVGPMNPYHQVYLMRTAYTDSDGIATVSFRIPWPWEHAEEITFGTWLVNATVALPDRDNMEEKTYFDTLTFEVGWIVQIKSVITVDGPPTYAPKETFKKDECVGVKINITNIAKEDRRALIAIVVYDDVGMPIAHYVVILEINWTGTEPITIYCKLPVPKWAYVGPHGMVYASAYTKWLKDGGVPWCPEVSHLIEIAKA